MDEDKKKRGRPAKVKAGDVWGSKPAREARSKVNKAEEELKVKFHESHHDLFGRMMMMDTFTLESFFELAPNIVKLKKRIDESAAKGYIRDEPILTKKETVKIESSLCDEKLFGELKEYVGCGRKAQKFKYEYEARGVFNRRLMKECPDPFLKLTVVRKTLAKLYESIDISNFELKDKDVEEKTKDMTFNVSQREYDKACCEQVRSVNKTVPLEPDTDDEYEKPSVASILEKAELESESDDEEYNSRKKLTPTIIEKRMKKCYASYKRYKKEIAGVNRKDPEYEEILITLETNAVQCKSDFRRYESLLKVKLATPESQDFDKKFLSKYTNNTIARYTDDNTGEVIDLNELADINLFGGKTAKTMSKIKTKYSEELKDKVRDELKTWLGRETVGGSKDSGGSDDVFDFYGSSKKTTSNILEIMFEDNLEKDERKVEFKTIIKSLSRKKDLLPQKKLTKACEDDMEMMLGMFESEYKSFVKGKQS
jgi:hypothetical protein